MSLEVKMLLGFFQHGVKTAGTLYPAAWFT